MSVNNKVNISSHPINASNVLKLLMSDIQPKVWNLCLIVLFRCKLCELEKQIVILNEKHEKVHKMEGQFDFLKIDGHMGLGGGGSENIY